MLTVLGSPVGALFAAVAAIAVFESVGRIRSEPRRRAVVTALSIGLLGWLDPGSLALLAALATLVFAGIRSGVALRGRLMPIVVGGLIVLIAARDLGRIFSFEQLWVPLGVSYYFFRLLAVVIEHARRPKQTEGVDALTFYSWVFFGPVLLAGPILRFGDFGPREDHLDHRVRVALYRAATIAIVAKVLVVDTALAPIAYGEGRDLVVGLLDEGPSWTRTTFAAGYGVVAWTHAYLDLMLYTELARAAAGLLGFTCVENFNRPWLASNVSKFWQRYHMSLSSWTRDYVFFPTLLRFRKTWLATLLTMLTMGMWHSTSANWFMWGSLHAVNMIVWQRTSGTARWKSWMRHPTLARLAGGFGVLFTLWFVSQVFTLVAFDDLDLAIRVVVAGLSPPIG